jgi:hypothetical protein
VDVVKFLDVYEESEGLWNIRNSGYNNKIKRDSAMLKLMGELLRRNVAVLYCDIHYYEIPPCYIFGLLTFPFSHII